MSTRIKQLRRRQAAMIGIARARAMGHRLGRHATLSPEQLREIARLRKDGMTYRAIGEVLDIPKTVVWENHTVIAEKGLDYAIKQARENARFAADYLTKNPHARHDRDAHEDPDEDDPADEDDPPD